MPTSLGTVSHYELRQLLGAGGMGEVYLAFDTVLRRHVAIKFLHPQTADRESTRRLRREAQAAAALDHPCICAVYEVGTAEDGRDFIVMQYVEGETLASVLRHGPLGVAAALDLARRIADALDVAHRRGVIHRDLKPQNVVVTPSGVPKLLDFGIAVVRRAGPENSQSLTTTHLESAAIVGTPPYMAPEVLQGRDGDARSDLFSLGVLLYQCLTGCQPFRGATPLEIWGRVLHATPDAPSELNPAVNASVDAVCAKLLAKVPADRYQSAAEVCGALQVLRGVTSVTPRSTRRPSWPAVGIAASVVLTAGLSAAWWLNPPPRLPPPPAEAEGWYSRGIDSVRQGAYISGRRALEEAIRLYPDYALAHSRLAEALSALDEEREAQSSLIRVSLLLPDIARLPLEDRLRLDGIRATVLRDYERAISAYEELARVRTTDAGALVDLGRAQEAAGRLNAARDSYERATKLDSQFSAGFLRLGALLGEMGRLSDAIAAIEEAERLYALASNDEGRVEALLQRAATLDAAGRYGDSAKAASSALGMAQQHRSVAQEIRAGFLVASAHVASGAFGEAEAAARAYVDRALRDGLQTIAASGLIDLAGTLLASERLEDSDAALSRASAIADERALSRVAMRAATQRASLKEQAGAPSDALALLEAPLAYFASTKLRRLEAVALTIAARANRSVGNYAAASMQLERVLTFADDSQNDELKALARSSLATLAASQGQFPQALAHRAVALAIRAASGDVEALPYDQTNHAEVMVHLGRVEDATSALDELDAAIARRIGAYPTRERRVQLVRALLAMSQEDYPAALTYAARVDPSGQRADETSQLARMVHAVAAARLGSRRNPPQILKGLELRTPGAREVHLWRSTALLAAGDATSAVTQVEPLLDGDLAGGAEFEWRAAAVSAMAFDRIGTLPDARRRAEQALAAFTRLSSEWGVAVTTYATRRDVSRMLGSLRTIARRTTAQQ